MTNINFKKIDEKAKELIVENSSIILTCSDISMDPALDRRLVLTYKTGYNIEVPENMYGIVLPVLGSHMFSLEFAGGLATLTPGFNGELIVKMKTNTDSIPAIFEPGDKFARLIFMPVENININIIEPENDGDKQQENTEVDKSDVQ